MFAVFLMPARCGQGVRKCRVIRVVSQEHHLSPEAPLKPSSTLDALKHMATIQEQLEALQGDYEGLKGLV